MQPFTAICIHRWQYVSLYCSVHYHTALYNQLTQFGPKISADIFSRILCVLRCENCELRGTDNVQGRLCIHIFAAKEAIVFFLLQMFATLVKECLYTAYLIEQSLNRRLVVVDVRFANCRILFRWYSRASLSFAWKISSHLLRLDQSRASKNISWIIHNNIYP